MDSAMKDNFKWSLIYYTPIHIKQVELRGEQPKITTEEEITDEKLQRDVIYVNTFLLHDLIVVKHQEKYPIIKEIVHHQVAMQYTFTICKKRKKIH